MSLYLKSKCEIRTTPCHFVVRERRADPAAVIPDVEKAREEGKGEADGRVIEGVAIVFGPEYRVTDEWGDTYVEKISPDAVTSEWLKTQDVKLNLLHERDMTIARWNRGVGNMDIWVKKDGVHFSFEAPECDLGDRALALIRAGVYVGCSFEFYPGNYEVQEATDADGNTVTVVTHTLFERLDALTIAMDPAYEETRVSVRELREMSGKGLCTAGVGLGLASGPSDSRKAQEREVNWRLAVERERQRRERAMRMNADYF